MTFPVARDNELPALGRPLHLGILYDRRSDTFLPGVTLWDPETLQKHVNKKPQPKTEFQVLASDSYDHLASALHLTLPLKASLLGGHMDLNGSARYLKDTKKSKNQVRVVLHSSITTRFEELTMTHLGPQNVAYPGVLDQGEATHVVTAVLYGAQAFFVFDRNVASAENKDDVERELRDSLQSFCNKVHAGEGAINRPEKEKTNMENFKCTFYGDVTLENNPITDPDAMKIYSDLPKLLGGKGEKAVPVKVWLYPLAKLDHRAAQLVREISADLVARAQSVVEQLSDCEQRCQDLGHLKRSPSGKMTALCMEENIYNLLLPVEEEKPFLPPRYISTFRASVKREAQAQNKAPCKTMGLPKLQVPAPKDFLQKYSKTPKLPKWKKARGSKKSLGLMVPQRMERPLMGIRSKKNFVTGNAAEAILQEAKRPLRSCVDMRKGDKFLIDNSGLVQKYLKKKDFGAVPRYLAKRNKAAKRAKEESDNCIKETLRQKGPKRVSEEEREGLLEGLKKNWEEINQAFQSMSVAVDMIPRKLYREKLETQMKQLEHDIGILERHQVIYIANK